MGNVLSIDTEELGFLVEAIEREGEEFGDVGLL